MEGTSKEHSSIKAQEIYQTWMIYVLISKIYPEFFSSAWIDWLYISWISDLFPISKKFFAIFYGKGAS